MLFTGNDKLLCNIIIHRPNLSKGTSFLYDYFISKNIYLELFEGKI